MNEKKRKANRDWKREQRARAVEFLSPDHRCSECMVVKAELSSLCLLEEDGVKRVVCRSCLSGMFAAEVMRLQEEEESRYSLGEKKIR